MEEGIRFSFLTAPLSILGYENPSDPRDPKNGFVRGMLCQRMELGEPDSRGRRSPVAVPDSEFGMEADCVIMAIGTSPNPLITATTDGLTLTPKGGIAVDEHGMTSRRGVFAGGDAVTGAATVILAMGAGKVAAAGIHRYLNETKGSLS
jgi:glutamate synthase (NADPH/NADH) small chain